MKLWRFWKRLPAKYFLLVLLLCAYFKDTTYPFSDFPMYSRLDDVATYVYVTSGNDEPLALDKHFAQRSSNLSKSFRNNLNKKVKARRGKRKDATPQEIQDSGREALAHLEYEGRARRPEVPRQEVLKLWYVEILRDGNSLREDPVFAGSVTAAEVEQLAGKKGDDKEDSDDEVQ